MSALPGYDNWLSREPEQPEPLDIGVDEFPDAIRERFEERVREAAGEAFDKMDPTASAFLNEQPEDTRTQLARWAIRFALDNDQSAEEQVQLITERMREAFIQKRGAEYADGPLELAHEEYREWLDDAAREDLFARKADNEEFYR